jgi:PAS domain S-box-containing protein
MTPGPSAPLILSVVALAAAAILATTLGIVVWRRRGMLQAPAFVALMAAGATWAAAYALELAVAEPAAKVAWLKLEYVGIVTVPVAWLAFALDYTGRRHRLTPRLLALLGVVPVVTLLLVATNEAHGLIWREIALDTAGPFPALRLARGPWYWVNVAQAYLALAAGSLLLAAAVLRAPRRDRRAAGVLLLAVAGPWLANALYQTGAWPLPTLDPTPLAFAVGGLAFAWGLVRLRALDVFPGLAPMAREAVVDGMRDGVLVLDPRGVVVDVNPAAARLLGRPAPAVLGRRAADALAGWPAAVVDGPAGAETEVAFDVPDAGGPRRYDLRISPLRRPDGRPAGRLVVARDVTERRLAERRLALLAEAGAALSSSLDYEVTLGQVARLVTPTLADYCFVDVVDEQRVIRDVAVAHVDPEREEWLRQLRRLYPPDPEASFGVAAVLRTGRSALIAELPDDLLVAAAHDAEHLRLLRALGPTSYMIAPLIARGQLLGAISFGATGAGRRYGPDDLALAEELSRRAAAAIDHARLYAAAQAAIGLREEFLGVAAHELRTPLTTLKGYTQFLARLLGQSALDRDRLTAAHAALERQLGRLERLVADLLDVARMQRGELALRPEPMDLVDLARQVLDRFEQAPERSARHRLVLEATEAVVGRWDPDRLDQALTNLVSNALKYSPAGGEVRVRVARCDGAAIVRVRDEGLGLAPEEQAGIFRPYARGRAARGVEGTGLGLYVAAQVAARHGGTIAVESTLGAGSTFTIRLPLAGPPPHAGASASDPSQDEAGARWHEAPD